MQQNPSVVSYVIDDAVLITHLLVESIPVDTLIDMLLSEGSQLDDAYAQFIQNLNTEVSA